MRHSEGAMRPKNLFVMITVLISFALPAQAEEVSVTKGTFITPDRDAVKISYNLYLPPKKGKVGIILLHMLGQDKSDWNIFATKLATDGFGVMAFDFRGHGESLFKKNDRPIFYREFTKSNWGLLKEDVRGAVQEMVRQGFESLGIVGASIGANAGVSFTAKDPSINALVLLSPGIDYRGIRIDTYSGELKVPMLIISSEEDHYSFKSSQQFIKSLNPERIRVTWFPVKDSGHGTRMLKNEKVVESIEGFLKKELLKE